MIRLYTQKMFKSANSRDKVLPFRCEHCHKIFMVSKHRVQNALNPKKLDKLVHCSRQCANNSQKTKKEVVCKTCRTVFKKAPSKIKLSDNHFCSQSCAATHTNTHRTSYIRRSKLEIYLEQCIRKEYASLTLLCNDKVAVGSEVDYYFPDLGLAIELSGIFHYKPIYGADKLSRIQANDQRKATACAQAGIALEVIDSSADKHTTLAVKAKYWGITKTILNRYVH